jgi:hypothetical protein
LKETFERLILGKGTHTPSVLSALGLGNFSLLHQCITSVPGNEALLDWKILDLSPALFRNPKQLILSVLERAFAARELERCPEKEHRLDQTNADTASIMRKCAWSCYEFISEPVAPPIHLFVHF